MEPDFEELLISNEIIEKETYSDGCNVDLQQNCLSAKKYNVAYVRSKDTNRFRFDFAADTDGSRLCEIACTQVRGLKYVIFKILATSTVLSPICVTDIAKASRAERNLDRK